MNRRNFIKNTLITAAVAAGGSILGKTAKSALLRENKKMKILVLTGSPRPNGNSNTLADNFIKGAEAAGHKVFRFYAAFKQVHPGIASYEGIKNKRPYIFVAILTIAGILTPPDIVSQLMLTIPTYLLFEAGLFAARKYKRTGD